MTNFEQVTALERDPLGNPARAARGQARRATSVWVFSGSGDPLGALAATDLDGSLLVALPVDATVPTGTTVTLAIADHTVGQAAYRSLQTVRLEATSAPRHRQRFVNRQPGTDAALNAGHLQLWHAVPVRVRLLTEGSGNIALGAGDYLLDPGTDPELTEKEQANLEHQNKDHLDINLQLATQMLGEPEGHWLLTGLDPEGMDFVCGDRRGRLPFPEPVFDRPGLGRSIKTYLKEARARLGIEWSF
jgi:hypothetical protein